VSYAGPPNNPYGLPPTPPAPPTPPNPYANPYAPPPSPYTPPPGAPGAAPLNPYAPPSLGAETYGSAHTHEFEVLADRGARLGAHIIDNVLLFGAAMIGLPGVIISEDVGVVMALFGVAALLVYQWYLLSTTGQTLAKKWLKIRIVKLDGSPVDFVSAVLLRNWVINVVALGGSMLVLGSFLPLIDVLLIFGDERRCLHDHIAGTKVIAA
jgi:uncharacterized RDD family membrane protein YckC